VQYNGILCKFSYLIIPILVQSCIQSRVQCNSMSNMGILQHGNDVDTYKGTGTITFLSMESTIMFLNCYNKV